MNILIPHSWLQEHLETTATPADIQRELSLCGPSVERIYEREGEPVYDIEITTNRVDSMSVRGVAREAAVILTQAGFPSQLKPAQQDFHEFSQTFTDFHEAALPHITNDPTLCSRILCTVLTNIEHTPTPDWMAKRLRQVELNVHDSVIDITNYITHDLGHPCHAFDYDKVMALGGEIIVTTAKPGQSFMTLDGVSYQTKGGEVVFTNPKGEIIDLPAIKGTANTAISDETTRILFWIETIDAKKVRQASMAHAIRTVAAQLNEKGVDPHLAEPVFMRGVELYRQLCQAQVASPIYNDFPGQRDSQVVTMPLADIKRYLGIELPQAQIQSILESLECQVKVEGQTLHVTPPSFRPDLEMSADIVEEVARIYGYHRLPSVIMDTAIPTAYQPGINFQLESLAKQWLAHTGWQELYTYSTVSAETATASGWALEEHIKLHNPLDEDHVYLRRSLIPSLVATAQLAATPKPARVFELAMTYLPTLDGLPEEKLHLALVSHEPYRVVRGYLERLLADMHLPDLTFKAIEHQPGWLQAAEITSQDLKGETITLGLIGVVAPNILGIDLTWSAILESAHLHPTYQPLTNTMPVIEDLTFTVPATIAIGELIAAMRGISTLITKVELKDQFHRNFTFTIHYQDAMNPIAAATVTELRKQLIAQAASREAVLVGTVDA